jgi:hypothetical protein
MVKVDSRLGNQTAILRSRPPIQGNCIDVSSFGCYPLFIACSRIYKDFHYFIDITFAILFSFKDIIGIYSIKTIFEVYNKSGEK